MALFIPILRLRDKNNDRLGAGEIAGRRDQHLGTGLCHGVWCGEHGIDRPKPFSTRDRRQRKRQRQVFHIENYVDVLAACRVSDRECQYARVRVREPRAVERAAVECNILEATCVRVTREEVLSAQGGVTLAEVDHPSSEGAEVGICGDKLPIEPADRVVLNVGVVVALLCSPALITCQQHGNALGKKQYSEEVTYLSRAQRLYCRICGGTLDPVVVADVVGVARILAVRLVMLLVVAHDIVERKAVVAGNVRNAVQARSRPTETGRSCR